MLYPNISINTQKILLLYYDNDGGWERFSKNKARTSEPDILPKTSSSYNDNVKLS